MSSSTLVFLLLVIGMPLAMMFMHRGGHAHGGTGGGGCGGGHGGHHARRSDGTVEPGRGSPVGPPGTGSHAPEPVAAQKHQSRGLREDDEPAVSADDAGHNRGSDDATS